MVSFYVWSVLLLFAGILHVGCRCAHDQKPGMVLFYPDVGLSLSHGEEESIKTRNLLQNVGQTPICEMNIVYAITNATTSNITTSITLSNNRELASDWQLVYRYVDYINLKLVNVTGATALTYGSAAGSPVRIVDSFTLDSSGIPSGANHTFTTYSQFRNPPPVGSESLMIQNITLNGLQCSLIPTSVSQITYSSCSPALSLQINERNDTCTASFCCGYILSNSIVPLPLPPIEATPPGQSSDANSTTPTAPNPPLGGYNSTTRNSTNDTLLHGNPPVPPLLNETALSNNSNLGPLLGGVITAAITLLAAIITTAIVFRLKRRKSQAKHERSTTADHLAAENSLKKTSLPPSSIKITAKISNNASTASGAATITSLNSDMLNADGDVPEEVKLYELLGSGAFGSVYRGEWGGKIVAVKVLQTACTSNSKELSSFRKEVSVLSRIRHPNVISFLAACTVPPDICIIEELAEGGSLHAKLHGVKGNRKCSPLPMNELLGIAEDIASAMAYLHPKIIHRDLKSQNVLLTKDGRGAKIADFGIAKWKERTFVSTMNATAGTPSYMGPECFEGSGNITEKVDVYSYSILLWEMLTGQIPWSNVASPMQIIYYVGVMGMRPEFPTYAQCPPSLQTLITICWSESPQSRPSFNEILVQLKEIRKEFEVSNLLDFAMPPPPNMTYSSQLVTEEFEHVQTDDDINDGSFP